MMFTSITGLCRVVAELDDGKSIAEIVVRRHTLSRQIAKKNMISTCNYVWMNIAVIC
jgi:hypothetical protein